MKTSLKIILRKDGLKKDGLKPIYLRVIINSKIKNIHMGIDVKEKDFYKGHVKQSDPYNEQKNMVIDSSLERANKIIFDARVAFTELTIPTFISLYNSYRSHSASFYDYIDQELPYWKEMFAIDTIRGYHSQVSKLQKFRSDISFQDIDIQFVKEYQHYMLSELHNDISTCYKSLAFIKQIINKAIVDGELKDNPFKNFPIKRFTGNRTFLSLEELNRLNTLYWKGQLPGNKNNVLRYFLFCCYTGLRYKDIKNLKFSDIQIGQLSNSAIHKIIIIDMHKTGKPVRIPVIEPAEKLIPADGFDQQPVFNVLTDQPTNRYLKEIMKVAEIHKNISFHCSRHTFATIGRSLGISLDIISVILGHTDLKTTRIYTKYEDTMKIQEMLKWNKIT